MKIKITILSIVILLAVTIYAITSNNNIDNEIKHYLKNNYNIEKVDIIGSSTSYSLLPVVKIDQIKISKDNHEIIELNNIKLEFNFLSLIGLQKNKVEIDSMTLYNYQILLNNLSKINTENLNHEVYIASSDIKDPINKMKLITLKNLNIIDDSINFNTNISNIPYNLDIIYDKVKTDIYDLALTITSQHLQKTVKLNIDAKNNIINGQGFIDFLKNKNIDKKQHNISYNINYQNHLLKLNDLKSYNSPISFKKNGKSEILINTQKALMVDIILDMNEVNLDTLNYLYNNKYFKNTMIDSLNFNSIIKIYSKKVIYNKVSFQDLNLELYSSGSVFEISRARLKLNNDVMILTGQVYNYFNYKTNNSNLVFDGKIKAKGSEIKTLFSNNLNLKENSKYYIDSDIKISFYKLHLFNTNIIINNKTKIKGELEYFYFTKTPSINSVIILDNFKLQSFNDILNNKNIIDIDSDLDFDIEIEFNNLKYKNTNNNNIKVLISKYNNNFKVNNLNINNHINGDFTIISSDIIPKLESSIDITKLDLNNELYYDLLLYTLQSDVKILNKYNGNITVSIEDLLYKNANISNILMNIELSEQKLNISQLKGSAFNGYFVFENFIINLTQIYSWKFSLKIYNILLEPMIKSIAKDNFNIKGLANISGSVGGFGNNLLDIFKNSKGNFLLNASDAYIPSYNLSPIQFIFKNSKDINEAFDNIEKYTKKYRSNKCNSLKGVVILDKSLIKLGSNHSPLYCSSKYYNMMINGKLNIKTLDMNFKNNISFIMYNNSGNITTMSDQVSGNINKLQILSSKRNLEYNVLKYYNN